MNLKCLSLFSNWRRSKIGRWRAQKMDGWIETPTFCCLNMDEDTEKETKANERLLPSWAPAGWGWCRRGPPWVWAGWQCPPAGSAIAAAVRWTSAPAGRSPCARGARSSRERRSPAVSSSCRTCWRTLANLRTQKGILSAPNRGPKNWTKTGISGIIINLNHLNQYVTTWSRFKALIQITFILFGWSFSLSCCSFVSKTYVSSIGASLFVCYILVYRKKKKKVQKCAALCNKRDAEMRIKKEASFRLEILLFAFL